MDLSWLAEPQTWVGFLTLFVLEVVLGIDNLVFVAIIANKVKPALRDKARISGLTLAVGMRILMLAFMAHIITLTAPLFSAGGHAVSGKDLIMLGGGLFLLYKATTELHERLEGSNHYAVADQHKKHSPFFSVVVPDSDSGCGVFHRQRDYRGGDGRTHHGGDGGGGGGDGHHDLGEQTAHRLCRAPSHGGDAVPGLFADDRLQPDCRSLPFHIPKGYLYAAIGFSILIEAFNQVAQRNAKRHDYAGSSWRQRTAENVLGMMGIREKPAGRFG